MNPDKDDMRRLSGSGVFGKTIYNEEDLEEHLDYIHCNPVKHGYVNRAADWA
ncbi:MAG: hypothetical protein FD147_1595 [Chloroflexi bacterium]|nr:MAG: hypothetical protein FD147_1595 [Chloroflexota bacterium]